MKTPEEFAASILDIPSERLKRFGAHVDAKLVRDTQLDIAALIEQDRREVLDWVAKRLREKAGEGTAYVTGGFVFAVAADAVAQLEAELSAPPATKRCATCRGTRKRIAADVDYHEEPCPDCTGRVAEGEKNTIGRAR